MKKQLLILIFMLLCGVSMAQKAPAIIKAKDVTLKNQAEYTSQVAKRFNDAYKPYNATIKLLKEYHKVKPKETEAAIMIIGDAVEAKFTEDEKKY